MARKSIPKGVREQVEREFRHLCAVCGGKGPLHVHHIDEDPSNNDPENLIPLCPNCHLQDEHNPTARRDPELLRLFRIHKDPTILSPQFEPLFRRTRFMYHLDDVDDLRGSVGELLAFVEALNMGDYYAKQVRNLIHSTSWGLFNVHKGPSQREIEEERRERKEKVLQGRDAAMRLLVEQIRYQPWTKEQP